MVMMLSLDVDIRGLKELQRELETMQQGMTPSVVNEWCKRIESEAKNSCPEEEKESIVINAVPKEPNKFDIQLKSSKKALPYIRESVQRNLPSMPITTRAVFETLLKQIDQRMS